MNEYEAYKRILELWEQGKSKEDIRRITNLSNYKIRACLAQFRSVAQLNEEMGYEQTDRIKPREYKSPKYKPRERSYTDEELAEAIAESYSYAQALRKLGLRPAGGNYSIIKKRIAELELDTSHFKGQGWSKGIQSPIKRQLAMKDILVKGSHYQSSKLRKRLIDEGYFEHRCGSCDLTAWLGQAIPLELHHKNGDRSDNRIENLILLCPNCHALTDTYRGKNISVNIGTN